MKFLCQFGLNPSSGSGDIVQTKSYADADADTDDADGIHTKNNMSPTPSEGGHNYFGNKISSCKCPVGVHHVGMISNCSIKNCGQVGVDRPVKAFTCKKKKTKKNCLSSHSCHFIKNYYFIIKILHANVHWVCIMLA